MNALYDRRETADHIEFDFHYLPLVSGLFFLMLAGSLASGCCRPMNRLLRRCGALLILWLIGLLPAWIEIEKATANGSATFSGSKLSCTNPLKVVIAKKSARQPAASPAT